MQKTTYNEKLKLRTYFEVSKEYFIDQLMIKNWELCSSLYPLRYCLPWKVKSPQKKTYLEFSEKKWLRFDPNIYKRKEFTIPSYVEEALTPDQAANKQASHFAASALGT